MTKFTYKKRSGERGLGLGRLAGQTNRILIKEQKEKHIFYIVPVEIEQNWIDIYLQLNSFGY
jgi:hypothetical protein